MATGIAQDVAVAMLIDIVTSSRFDDTSTDLKADSESHPDYQRGPDPLVLVHGTAPLDPGPPDARDEADFVKPIGWLRPS